MHCFPRRDVHWAVTSHSASEKTVRHMNSSYNPSYFAPESVPPVWRGGPHEVHYCALLAVQCTNSLTSFGIGVEIHNRSPLEQDVWCCPIHITCYCVRVKVEHTVLRGAVTQCRNVGANKKSDNTAGSICTSVPEATVRSRHE